MLKLTPLTLDFIRHGIPPSFRGDFFDFPAEHYTFSMPKEREKGERLIYRVKSEEERGFIGRIRHRDGKFREYYLGGRFSEISPATARREYWDLWCVFSRNCAPLKNGGCHCCFRPYDRDGKGICRTCELRFRSKRLERLAEERLAGPLLKLKKLLIGTNENKKYK
jgi:hypothetical protein